MTTLVIASCACPMTIRLIPQASLSLYQRSHPIWRLTC